MTRIRWVSMCAALLLLLAGTRVFAQLSTAQLNDLARERQDEARARSARPVR